jgi:hypothetical protein
MLWFQRKGGGWPPLFRRSVLDVLLIREVVSPPACQTQLCISRRLRAMAIKMPSARPWLTMAVPP